jgi:predicted nucleic acid-binding protein
MPFVIDASIAVCWLMPDERHPMAEAASNRIVRDLAYVPALWWFELRNVLIIHERRGRLNEAKSAEALKFLRALPVTTDMGAQEDELMRLARTHGLTAYDAAYLELAQRKGIPLATLDKALASAACAEAVPLIDA